MRSEHYVCAQRRGRACLFGSFVLSLACVRLLVPDGVAGQEQQKRRLTQEDSIRMARIAGQGSINNDAGMLTEDFAFFSPDQKRFVIVLKKGNLRRNTNDYSLLLFESREVFAAPEPKVLAMLSSSSNREGITDVAWLADSATILFRGENPGESSQLFEVNANTGALRKLTNHPTNLITFSSDTHGETIVYAAERPRQPVLNEKSAREGFAVSREDVSELLMGERRDELRELFVFDTKTGKSRPLPITPELNGGLARDYLHFSVSPDGKHVVARLNLFKVDASWREYRQPLLARILDRTLPKDSLTWMFRYAVIDTDSGAGRVLLDGPVSYYGSDVTWGSGSKSLVLTGVFPPLDAARKDPESLANPRVIEVSLSSLEYRVLNSGDLRLVRKSPDGKLLTFETRRRSGSETAPERKYFRENGLHWVPVDKDSSTEPAFIVAAKQDLNTAPQIVVIDAETKRQARLLDPNPQFSEIEFGKVQEIVFTGAERKSVHAGLYFPVGYAPGEKYPMVVQTHGFDPKSFWVDGPYTTAFAAQALAARGFLVLQVPDLHDWDESPAEAPNMMETIERAIEYVDGLGCLDRERLGITGFSRTGLYVHYMLVHSKFHFQAAIAAESSDGGYSQYLQFLNANQFTASDSEMLNGGAPFGGGLLYWIRRAPEFSLDLVKTPLMMQANTPQYVAMIWAPFVGLKRLGRPVDLIFFPTGTHIMEKPWDRLVSQGSAVDWYAFWLKKEKSTDPEKLEQYRRWDGLRSLQEKQLSTMR